MTEKSNIKLKSNIMTKDRTTGMSLNSVIPVELLRDRISVSNPFDVRMFPFLPKHQQEEVAKVKYLATRITDVENRTELQEN